MEWLLELMGYIRNIAYQSTSVQNVTLDEVQSRGVTCGSRTFVLPKDQKVAACLFPPPLPFTFGQHWWELSAVTGKGMFLPGSWRPPRLPLEKYFQQSKFLDRQHKKDTSWWGNPGFCVRGLDPTKEMRYRALAFTLAQRMSSNVWFEEVPEVYAGNTGLRQYWMCRRGLCVCDPKKVNNHRYWVK